MTKSEAIRLFGKTQVELAAALGITKQAVSAWPDVLPQEQRDRVVGAAVRLGKPLADIPAGVGTAPQP